MPYDPWNQDSKPGPNPDYFYPHGTYGSSPAGGPQPPRRGSGRTIALVAAFLVVAILFSVLTGVIVFAVLQGPVLEGRFALPTLPTRPEIREQTQPSDQVQPPAKTTEPGATDQEFSISDLTDGQPSAGNALSIVEIARIGKPAVVAINTETLVSSPFGNTGLVPAAGSGFILTRDGYIVTNHHVVAGARTISVVLDNGDAYDAAWVGSDPGNDLAVLKIDGQDLPTVRLGHSSDLEVGELAVAIGNPLGELSGTVTAGIISALDRAVTIDGQTLYLLQTDAAINAGNSGGALFNSFGEVIGINTAKNAGAGIEGLGFAIPIDHAKPIIETIIRSGSLPGKPRIGLYTQDIDESMAAEYDLPVGVYITQVEPGSPADDAGLRQGDVIVAINGQEALTTAAINEIKNQFAPGDRIDLTIIRDGRERAVSVILGEDLA